MPFRGVMAGLIQIGFRPTKKLTIACKEKSIRIIEIQKEGKKKLSIDEFLKGTQILVGSKIT